MLASESIFYESEASRYPPAPANKVIKTETYNSILEAVLNNLLK